MVRNWEPLLMARKVDPLFTDQGDGYGPVGNDTGHDTYSSYRKWCAAKKPSQRFLPHLLKSWAIPDRDWEDVDPEVVARQLEASPFHRLVRDDAIIALAFAQFFADEEIDPQVLQRALWAIEAPEFGIRDRLSRGGMTQPTGKKNACEDASILGGFCQSPRRKKMTFRRHEGKRPGPLEHHEGLETCRSSCGSRE